jgi:hypothetical protein
MRGVDKYISESGFSCIRIHYTADAEKDPATVDGKRWLDAELRGYPGGLSSSAWRQEMEIDWDAAGGDLVFPQLGPYRSKIVVPPIEIPEGWMLFGSYDYGHRNPASFHVHCLDYDGNIWTVWEFYDAGIGYREQAKRIRACPLWDRLSTNPIADPSIWAETQERDNEVKSIAQLFAELPEKEQIFFMRGSKGGDVTAAEKVNGSLWQDLDSRKPRWRIFASCPKLIWELGNLRYADWSQTTSETRNIREEIVDKDNHAWDDFKMFLMRFFAGPVKSESDEKLDKLRASDPASYREWKNARKIFDGGRQKGQSNLGDFY